MKPLALVVENDGRIMLGIEDVLFSIGHELHQAKSQEEAQQFLEKNDYAYILLDPQIPAKAGRDGASIQFGAHLVDDIRRIKGVGAVPVIIMTEHSAETLNLATRLRANGVADFIALPFPETGRTLAVVICDVLSQHEAEWRKAQAAPATEKRDRPQPFAGGEMVFYLHHVLLCGVKIITDKGFDRSIRVLAELRKMGEDGRFVALSAEDLAEAIRADNIQVVTGCVQTIRDNITSRLLKYLNVECGDKDVLGHSDQGYQLQPWITVRDAQDGEKDVPAYPPGNVPASPSTGARIPACPPADVPACPRNESVKGVPLNPRQEWVLADVAKRGKITRIDLQRQFKVAEKIAQRDFADLARQRRTPEADRVRSIPEAGLLPIV